MGMGAACGRCSKHAERIIKASRRCGKSWRFIAKRPCGPPPGRVQPPIRINLIRRHPGVIIPIRVIGADMLQAEPPIGPRVLTIPGRRKTAHKFTARRFTNASVSFIRPSARKRRQSRLVIPFQHRSYYGGSELVGQDRYGSIMMPGERTGSGFLQ